MNKIIFVIKFVFDFCNILVNRKKIIMLLYIYVYDCDIIFRIKFDFDIWSDFR